MNENPGDTPNPLNPTLTPENSGVNQVGQPAIQATPTIVPSAETASASAPASEPVQLPEKKKKTGLIVTIILLLVLIIGGAVAAVMILRKDSDPVAAAMNKIINGNMPTNVAVDGNIHVDNNDEDSPFSSVDINIKSSIVTNSLVNDSKVSAKIATTEGDLELEVEEIYAGSDGLYVKVEGITDIFDMISGNLTTVKEEPTLLLEEETELISQDVDYIGSSDTSNTLSTAFGGIIEMIDGEWLMISSDQLDNIPFNMTLNGSTECFEKAAKELRSNGNSLAEIYKKNSFIASTDEKVTLASKNYPVRKLNIDTEKLTGFANSFMASDIYNNINDCMSGSSSKQVNETAVEKTVSSLPDIFVEVDDDDNFSRFYTTFELEDSEATVTVDINLSYPTNINVVEPSEYIDLQDILQSIFLNMVNSSLPTDIDNYIEL